MANNIFQQSITPVKPKILSSERIYVYSPIATDEVLGIAKFSATQFVVNAGLVTMKLNDPTQVPSLVKLNSQDFERDITSTVNVRWPYAHNTGAGTNRTNGYGLIKIAGSSAGGLKYSVTGLLEIDTNVIQTKADMLALTTQVATNTSNITLLDGQLDATDLRVRNIENGTTVVPNAIKATQDANGNDIVNTYVPKTQTNWGTTHKITNELGELKLESTNVTLGNTHLKLQPSSIVLSSSVGLTSFSKLEILQGGIVPIFSKVKLTAGDNVLTFNGTAQTDDNLECLTVNSLQVASTAYVDRKITESKNKHKAFEFATYQNFIDWLAGTFVRPDERTIDDLEIGSDIYIIEDNVPDYWYSSETTPITIANFTPYDSKQNFVRFDTDAQALTSGQKLNARTNIDVYSKSEVYAKAETVLKSKVNAGWTSTVENKGDDIILKSLYSAIGGYTREHSISTNGDIAQHGDEYDYIKLLVRGNTSGTEKSQELKITENAITINNSEVLTKDFVLSGDATGDIYYRNSDGEFTRLAIGNENEQLLVSEGLPEWKVDYSKIIHLTSTEMEAQLSSLPVGTVCLCSDPLTTGTYVSKTIYIIIQFMAEKLWNRIGKLAILIKDENVILEPSDFVEDTTYSNFGYRANYDNIIYAKRTPDVYFSAETINNTITEENIFMIENWSESMSHGGLYIYAKNLPLTNVVIDKLEVFE